jgi:uncharacterized SAM-binding protein YcdF (DUF218 family)
MNIANPITINRKQRLISFSLFAFLFLGFVGIAIRSEIPSPNAAILKPLMESRLISTDPIPPSTSADAIYVLGGSQGSLESRFSKAADLYHKGISHRILILSRPGITQYSHQLKRNLTNDEWSLLKLEQLDVPKEGVEIIGIKEELFGTLREAKAISGIIKERGYKNAILISSPCHTRRVRLSFEKFLSDRNAQFFVQSSDGTSSAMGLLSEFIKLKFYENLLLL